MVRSFVPKKGQSLSSMTAKCKYGDPPSPEKGTKTVLRRHMTAFQSIDRKQESVYCHKNPPFWGSMCYECYKQHESEIYAEEEDRVKNGSLISITPDQSAVTGIKPTY